MDWIGVVAKKEREEEEEDGERGRGAVATLRKFEKALALLRSLSLSLSLPLSPNRRGQPAACRLPQQLPYRFLPAFAPHLAAVGRKVAKLALARYLTKNWAGPLSNCFLSGI